MLNRPPVFAMTMQGNLFLRTAQRHPRVYGPVLAHVVNNGFSFARIQNGGRWGSAYGMFVSNTARALVERNIYLPLDDAAMAPQPLGVWTTTTPRRGDAMPGEQPGFMRLAGNLGLRNVVLAENEPARVPTPAYAPRLGSVALDRLPPERALACVAARAGRFGATGWDRGLCGG